MKDKKILVTGGGGFLGKAIVKKLLERGCAVSSFSRGYYPELNALNVSQIQGDLTDKKAVDAAIAGKDIVYHVAAKSGSAGLWGRSKDFFNVNVTGTQYVIDACVRHNVDQLIYTSSPSVIFDDKDKENVDESAPYSTHFQSPYPESKAEAEKRVVKAAQKGLPAVVLRPHIIWGPEDPFLPRIVERAGRLKKIGPSHTLVDTIYIDNAADAHLLASEKLYENPSLSGNIYFVAQGEPIHTWDMIDTYLDIVGLPRIKGRISFRTAYTIGWIIESFYRLFRIKSEPPMTRFIATEVSTSHYFDLTKIKTELGYEPEISMEEGFKRMKQWYQSLES
jgi:nucleoside-diphosphate-sugar epimerase